MTNVATDTDTHTVTVFYDDAQVDIPTLEYALENAVAEGYDTYDWPVSHINVTAAQARKLIASNQPSVIDVREAWEYATDHIAGAILSPWNSNVF